MSGPGRPESLELILAQQANDAMQQGADPHAATEMLGTMIKHLRANPDLAAHASDALAQGADPHQVSAKVWEMAKASAQPHATPGQQFSALVGQGASMGFGAKILGGIDAANKMLPRSLGGESAPAADFGKNYTATRDRITGAAAEGVKEHPIAGRATEMVAGLATALPLAAETVGAKGVSLLARMGRGAATGAGVGAVSGAGHATGGVGDYAQDIGMGAGAGALLGAATVPAAEGVGALAKKAGEYAGSLVRRAGATDNVAAPAYTTVTPRATATAGGAQSPAIGVQTDDPVRDKAIALVLERLKRAGLTPQDAINRIAQIPESKPVTVMELAGDKSHPVRQLGKLVARTPSAGGADLRASMTERAEPLTNAKRVLGDVGEAMGVDRTNLVEHGQQMSGKRLAAAKPHYTAAEESPPVPFDMRASEDGPTLADIMKRPSVKAAIAHHNDVALERGEQPITLSSGNQKPPPAPPGFSPEQWAAVVKSANEKGITLPGHGPASPLLHPVRDPSGRLRRDLSRVADDDLDAEWQRLAELNNKEEALHGSVQDSHYRNDYEELPHTEKYGHKGQEDLPDADGMVDAEVLAGDNKIIKDYNKSVIVRAARKKAMERIEAEIQRRPVPGSDDFGGDVSFDFGTIAQGNGSATGDGVPLKTLQHIKFKLDEMLGFAKSRGQLPDGTPATKAKLGAINDTRRALLDIMNLHSPEYAKGNEVWAGESALQNAGETGRDFLKAPIDELQSSYGKMNPGEREQHNISALSGPLRDRLFKTSAVDRAKILAGPDIQERLQTVVPPERLAALKRNADVEHQIALTHQQIGGGSDTMENANNQFDAGGVNAEKSLTTALTHGPKRAVADMIKALVESKFAARMQGVNEKTSNALAPMLTAGVKSRKDSQELLDLLALYFDTANRRRGSLPYAGTAAGVAAGQLTTPQR